MATFILIAGSWHASWCWANVVPLLEEAGHSTIAPDLLGTGQDPTPATEITLASWADQVAGIVREAPEPVILVGHSRGGIVISEVAERVPDRIQALVYLTAFLVPDGKSMLSFLSGEAGDELMTMLLPGPVGTTILDEAAAAQIFYTATEPRWIDHAIAHLCPEPMHPGGTPLELTSGGFGSVPRMYIECEHDRALPVATQREMQMALPCDHVFTLQSDHSPFLSMPEELAATLLSCAEMAKQTEFKSV